MSLVKKAVKNLKSGATAKRNWKAAAEVIVGALSVPIIKVALEKISGNDMQENPNFSMAGVKGATVSTGTAMTAAFASGRPLAAAGALAGTVLQMLYVYGNETIAKTTGIAIPAWEEAKIQVRQQLSDGDYTENDGDTGYLDLIEPSPNIDEILVSHDPADNEPELMPEEPGESYINDYITTNELQGNSLSDQRTLISDTELQMRADSGDFAAFAYMVQ